jgi:hypothetical protein
VDPAGSRAGSHRYLTRRCLMDLVVIGKWTMAGVSVEVNLGRRSGVGTMVLREVMGQSPGRGLSNTPCVPGEQQMPKSDDRQRHGIYTHSALVSVSNSRRRDIDGRLLRQTHSRLPGLVHQTRHNTVQTGSLLHLQLLRLIGPSAL